MIELPVRSVRRLIEAHGASNFALPPEASLFDASRLMHAHGTDALAVVAGAALIGVLSTRNLVDAIGRGSRPDTRELRVADAMQACADLFVEPDTSVADALAKLAESGLEHMPVRSEGILIALLRRSALLADLVSHHVEELRQIRLQWRLMHLQGVYSC